MVRVAAFFLIVVAFAPRAQAQAAAQSSTQATAPLAGNDINSLRQHAAAGDPQAQFALAEYYFHGRYQTLEHSEALTWYLKSAGQGFAPAQNQLGVIYQHGLGAVRDYKRAVTYYRRAADQGYALAQFNLGAMYESGRYGVGRDYKQALA
jgi:TPR repeat protein